VSSLSDGAGDSLEASLRPGETLALVALGANLGDRLASLRGAVEAIGRLDGVRVLFQSSVFDTAPVGPPDQPRYLNAALALASALDARALLHELLAIEAALGRSRGETRWTARTIDLDLVLFGECVLQDGDLEIPHPRFRERAFVLLPLAEIAGSVRDPVTGERVESLLRACPGRSDAVRVGPLDAAFSH
jgi:2-amino-4-hydroxy-6-hydroxymethyldihydropteridine diphosphokinase